VLYHTRIQDNLGLGNTEILSLKRKKLRKEKPRRRKIPKRRSVAR
jgi:hypothetical protein